MVSEEKIEEMGRYAMSMKTDIWPYNPAYTGAEYDVDSLDSSTWRPDGDQEFNALWEEVFHTITEAHNRFDQNFGTNQLPSQLTTSNRLRVAPKLRLGSFETHQT